MLSSSVVLPLVAPSFVQQDTLLRLSCPSLIISLVSGNNFRQQKSCLKKFFPNLGAYSALDVEIPPHQSNPAIWLLQAT